MTSNDHSTAASTQSSTLIHPAAQSFSYGQGDYGVLLIHGYGGSIGDFQEMGQELAQRGYRVMGVCLAGHGYDLPTLAKAGIEDWRHSVFSAARELRQHCRQIAVLGASFGGALAIDYAAHAPDATFAVITINTALRYHGAGRFQIPLLKLLLRFTPYYPKRHSSPADRKHMAAIGSLPSWPISGILDTYRFIARFVLPALARLSVPLLVISSTKDPVVDARSAQRLMALAASPRKESWALPTNIHNLMRHDDLRHQVVERVSQFLQNCLARPS